MAWAWSVASRVSRLGEISPYGVGSALGDELLIPTVSMALVGSDMPLVVVLPSRKSTGFGPNASLEGQNLAFDPRRLTGGSAGW